MKLRKEETGETAVGRVVKTFGLHGELLVTLYDSFSFPEDETDTITEEPVYVRLDGLRVPLFFKSFRRRGGNKAVAVFDDLETENRASELTGKELFRLRTAPKAEEESFADDLIGYRVVFCRNGAEERQGEIAGLTGNESNPLFEVRLDDGRDVLIPIADEFIRSLDEPGRLVVMEVPEGLLSL